MADVLPINFPLPNERAMANYNYEDVADGTGVLTLYGATNKDSVSENYMLASNRIYSATTSTLIPNNTTTTYNFDLTPFNAPRTAKGTAFINVAVYNANAGDSFYFLIRVKKYSGGEVNVSSEIQSETISGNATYKELCIKIPLTQTGFKKGDYLRLTIKTVKTGAAGQSEFGHDPQDRAGTVSLNPATQSLTTSLIFYCPFKVDI